MSYSGTVRCSYCYRTGHNRATCESLKERMLRRLDENPEDRYALYHFEKKKSRKGKKKSCGYCDIPGHTRPTCLELKHARKVAVEKCAEWRKNYVEMMKTKGVGIGTLVEYTSWSEKHLGIITEIHWHRLDHRILYDGQAMSHALVVKKTTELNSAYGSSTIQIPEAEGVYSPTYFYRDNDRKFVGPVSPEKVEAQLPAGFLTGADCVVDIFGDNEKPKDRAALWSVEDWCPRQGFYEEDCEA